MTERAGRGVLAAWLLLVIASMIAVALSHDLWTPDEPRYARVAQEMLDRHSWCLPYLNGEPYSHKPPMQLWLTMILAVLFFGGRVTPPAARLPSLLASPVVLWLTWRLARRFCGERGAAMLAPVILAGTLRFQESCASAHFDMLLAAFCLGAVECFLESEGRPGVGFWLLVAGGLFTKGPVALLVVFSFVAPWLVLRGTPKALFSRSSLAGMALCLALFGGWIWCALSSADAHYGEDLLYAQTFRRIIRGMSHPHPWYYYLTRSLPLELFPWTLLLPGTILHVWKEGGKRLAPITWWAVVGLSGFSIIAEKRGLYLLPLYPALSILVADFCDTHARKKRARLLVWGTVITAMLLLLLPAAAPHLARKAAERGIILGLPLVAAPLLAPAFCGAVALEAIRRGARKAAVGVLAAALPAASLVSAFTLYPALDRLKSSRRLCASLERIPDVFCYAVYRPGYSYHLGRRIPRLDTPSQVREALEEHHTIGLFVLDKDLGTLRKELASHPTERVSMRILMEKRTRDRTIYAVELRLQAANSDEGGSK